MLKIIGLAALILIAGLLILAATRPDSFSIQRGTSIKAPPEKIFAFINELHNWDAWSPYEKKDPTMKKSFSGPAGGVGAVSAWEGNNEVGHGSMEITESQPSSKVVFKLDIVKPIEGHNIVEFTLQPQGNATDVTWRMHGPSPYIAKLMGIVFSMDNMVGKDFEIGLANLKAIAER